MRRSIRILAAVILGVAPLLAADLVNVSNNVAVSGYDTVAFFTDGKPVKGNPAITATHGGATYLFASDEHRKLFLGNPEAYVPQYGGYCAYGAAYNALVPVEISTWQIRNGKLYLNKNASVLKSFNSDFDGNVAKADKNWPGLVEEHGK